MTRPPLAQIPLAGAYLCGDTFCSTISNDSSRCPRCGSQVLSLARVLERLSNNQQPKEEAAA